MTIELLTGDAAAAAGTDDFNSMVSLRDIVVAESLQDRANVRLTEAFRNRIGSDLRLREAFTTSDFQLAAFVALDQEVQAQYAELPSVWREYTDVTKVRDFRPKRLRSRYRNHVGLSRVPENTEYPMEDQRSFDEYAIKVFKYGRRKAITWEAWLNNEAVQELEDIPTDLAAQAAETETINALSNLLNVTWDPNTGTATANGVNTNLFKAGNGNAPTALPLTYDNLFAVITSMATKKNKAGRVIAAPALRVVIPKALEATMVAILAINELRITDGDTTTVQGNALKNVDYVVEPMLDVLNTDAKAPTTWFVVPKPGAPRPALWAAFLAGYETPELRVKASAGKTIGGGDISFQEGSFELDDIQYRERHIVGNQTGEPLFTYASTGS